MEGGFGIETAGGEQSVDQFADGTVTAIAFADEVHLAQDFRVRIRGRGGEAGDLHGAEIVDVVAHEADVGEIEIVAGGELF